MGIFNNIFGRNNERDEKIKLLEEDRRINKILDERELSHDERLLKKSMEEDRQNSIRKALELDTKRRVIEDKIRSRESMRFNSELFNNKSILKDDNNFLWN